MIFAAPINTDAPIYHWPKATLGLIIFQVLVFVSVRSGMFGPEREVFESYALQYGEGLHPVQWLTSNFLHGGWLHLLGNVFFLWGLGLVVEGKLGSARFLAVFLGIGILECAIEQACLQGLEGESFGSSSILFGLLAMALLWAPVNEMTFAYVSLLPLLFRVGTFDLSIQWFAAIGLAQEVLIAWWNGFRPASEVLHLAGAALGLGIGWTMLRRGSVDCEGWDLFSRLEASRTPPPLRLSSREMPAIGSDGSMTAINPGDLERVSASKQRRATKQIRAMLSDGKVSQAWTIYQETRHWFPDWNLAPDSLLELAHALYAAERWEESVETFMAHLRQSPDSDQVRLLAAEVLVKRLRSPQSGLKVLRPLESRPLDPQSQKQLKRLKKEAYAMIDEGVVEFDRRV